jgi:hypothetical protein
VATSVRFPQLVPPLFVFEALACALAGAVRLCQRGPPRPLRLGWGSTLHDGRTFSFLAKAATRGGLDQDAVATYSSKVCGLLWAYYMHY